MSSAPHPGAAYLEAKGKLVDRAFEDYARVLKERAAPVLAEAMAYSLRLPGKRFRPALMMAACEAFGARDRDVLPFALAMEMIHTYSLIHDDLPCMDDADLRRGKASNHKVFGVAVAVLAGDALLADAFELAVEGPCPVGPGRRMRALTELAVAAGSTGMVSGQVLDVEAEGRTLSLEELEAVHRRKTGAMILAAAKIGGIIGRAAPRWLGALGAYAEALGLAFQVVDDILDVTGDERELGKSPGGDARRLKSTFPSLLGLEGASSLAEDLRDRALHAIDGFGPSGGALRDIARFVVDRRR